MPPLKPTPPTMKTGKVLSSPIPMTPPKQPPKPTAPKVPIGKPPSLPPVKPTTPVKLPVARVLAPPIEDNREILYPSIVVNRQEILEEDLKITFDDAVLLLGWENEMEYQTRIKQQNPDLKKAVSFGEDFILKDPSGQKVRFNNNANNRDFDETHMKKLAQEVLIRHYCLNLETIIISRYGNVISGQHRLAAFIYAVLLWRSKEQHEYWVQYWPEEPYILSLVAMGGSEDPRVLQTIDNTKTRTLTDVFFTSPLFRELDQKGRKEASRYMDYAVDLLWKRTEFVASNRGLEKVYQTHSSSVEFYDRHPKLLECVFWMYKANTVNGRMITQLRLSPGQCAALLYLMGSSSTDPDGGYLEDRTETILNWDNWENACTFWDYVKNQSGKADSVIFKALASLKDVDESGGLGGRTSEKQAILIKAWLLFSENGGNLEILTEEDLKLEYGEKDDGSVYLLDWPTCGGIDFGGDKPPAPKKKPTKEEEEEQAKEVERLKAERTKEVLSKVKETPAQEKARREQMEKQKSKDEIQREAERKLRK